MTDAPVDRDRARAALAANVAVLPGLGSLLVGRRVGWLQALLALAGFALTIAWLGIVLAEWWREGAPPVERPRLPLLGSGAGLFALAWAWALSTGLDALRRASPRSSAK